MTIRVTFAPVGQDGDCWCVFLLGQVVDVAEPRSTSLYVRSCQACQCTNADSEHGRQRRFLQSLFLPSRSESGGAVQVGHEPCLTGLNGPLVTVQYY